MTRTVQARFDGKAFHPEESLALAPDTTVLLTIETPDEEPSEGRRPSRGEPYSFLKLAQSLNLEGPEDWSENLDQYLYGGKKLPDV
jgi:hypothetical protein